MAVRDKGGIGDAAQAQAAGGERPLRVLIVDDVALVAESLQWALEEHGLETCVATSGADALRKAATFQPGAALIDLGLPDIDGYAVARQLRMASRGRRPILVALSGRPMLHEDDSESLFDHRLTKPMSLAVLLSLLDTIRST